MSSARWPAALLAFVACPGVVAIALPLTWLAATSGLHIAWPPGVIVLIVGLGALLGCVRDFYVTGRGTLAPWAPPQQLVTIGLYRYSRNPMYLAVLLMLLGWALATRSRGLFLYAAMIGVGFHLRVVLGEEPRLGRTYGTAWQAYANQVPRWVLR